MSELLKFLQSRRAEQLELLRSLVEMETPSDRKDLLDQFAESLVARYGGAGVSAQVVSCRQAGNLCRVQLDGQGRPILLLGHSDTVYPQGTIQTQPFRVEGGEAFGPGIFDMKSGIAATLELCRGRDAGLWHPRRPVWMLWTSDEEVGSATGRAYVEEMARRTDVVLVLEPPLPGGRAKTSRKGVGQFQIKAFGRSAHAGLAPEQGINAVEELAHQVLRLQRMSDSSRGIHVTVGAARGGTRANVVPAEAEALVDFRFPTAEAGRQIEAQFLQLTPVLQGARLEISGGVNRPPLERSASVARLWEQARAAAAEFGWELGEGSAGGGSDGNFTAALGTATLDGLGIDGDGAHSASEHIVLEDFARKTAILGRLIEKL